MTELTAILFAWAVLQQAAGKFGDCAQSMELEREAYAVQREYLLRNGYFLQVGVSTRGCE